MNLPDPTPSDEQVERAEKCLDTALMILKNAGWGGGPYWALKEKLEGAREALAAIQPQDGEAKAEPRSELRRKAAMSGTCPICTREMPR